MSLLRLCPNPNAIALPLLIFFSSKTLANPLGKELPRGLDDLLPSRNTTAGVAGEVQCYALPYGGIGIVSHLLTYWAIIWIGFGRSPLWPLHKLTHSSFDIGLAMGTIITTIPLASVSMWRCRIRWEFILIAVWKLTFSITQSTITIHRAWILRRENGPHTQERSTDGVRLVSYHSGWHSEYSQTTTSLVQGHPQRTPLYWLFLYLCGTIVGMVGLLSIVREAFPSNEGVRDLSYSFGIAIVVISGAVGAYFYKRHGEGNKQEEKSAFSSTFGGVFKAFVVCFGTFSALYSDLILASIADNWGGFPSQDKAALYWAWFVAKRLPLLSH
ncbi:hypothetical protein M501DRAFT_937417 [Patellaria atrata CBS 101060]|uniref:Uncharacterized protein n=1 Tax=Patellaria atrata CBS 101060 TaxID=1346257 RepID=A0A9P4VLH9_9PEZI|nr:hypothetical protein M501DRAFT_937417 [Patellaria atrata CBS 101060]